jgi:RimJ/RimL family protein N-acetyltransferase
LPADIQRATVPEDVKLRALTPADAYLSPKLAELEIVSWGYQLEPAQVEGRVERLAKQIRATRQDEAAIFIAQRSGEFVGLCRAARDRQGVNQWLLFGLVVHPAHRRQGVATGLVRACMRHAREYGAAVVRSETHVSNTPSIRLHESLGFDNEGQFIDADGDEKVAFHLRLD